METYKRLGVEFVKGEGVYLYDREGRRYLDFISGIGVVSLGHCNRVLVEALTEQAKRLWHTSNLYENSLQEELARRLSEKFWTKAKVFFTNSGTESVECAIKLTRKFFYEIGEKRYRILAFKNSFHGRTFGSLSATGQEKFKRGFRPTLKGFDFAPFNDKDAFKRKIKRETAGILLEVVQGEGGVIPAREEFLKEVERVCKEEGLLLIVDEVQTGVGRTGKFFAYEHFNLKPDIVTLAKGLGGGFPVGACLAREEVAKAFKISDHGSTFGGNFLACKVALKVVEEVEKILKEVSEVGEYLKERLRPYGKVRGLGLMVGLELREDCSKVVERLLREGVLVNCTAKRVLRFLPPLIVKREHVDEMIKVLDRVLRGG